MIKDHHISKAFQYINLSKDMVHSKLVGYVLGQAVHLFFLLNGFTVICILGILLLGVGRKDEPLPGPQYIYGSTFILSGVLSVV